VLGAQLAFTYLPAMQAVFGTASVDAGAWARAGLAALAILALVELEKLWRRRTSAVDVRPSGAP